MKIAAYCRVSTAKEEQLDSLTHQKEFFEAYAKKHGDELVGIYADEGISGTQLARRERFQALMEDARRGCFELVVVKDISRFARNTVDFLQSIRKLKEYGINTRFLTANMDSLGESEFVLTLFGALAQEESANLSKRVKFGKKLNAQKGRVPGQIYGYDRMDNFTLSMHPREAEVVRMVYAMYLDQGLGCRSIAGQLNGWGCITKQGCAWTPSAVHRLLTNPIYCGHHINHKYEVEDYLTGRQKKLPAPEHFHHHRPQWAIVSPQQFQRVQEQLARRRRGQEAGVRHSTRHLFSGLIVCGECGRSFYRKTYTYAKTRVYWKCSGCECGRCHNPTRVEEGRLLEVIEAHVKAQIAQPELLVAQLVQRLGREERGGDRREEELRRLEKRVERYTQLYVNEAISWEEYEKKKADVLKRAAQLRESSGMNHAANRLEMQVRRCVDWQEVSHGDMRKLVERITASGTGEVRVYVRAYTPNLPD